ncbi:MAG: hypothetical protein ACT4O3_00930 [Elusimicrobiota bacterium]
MIERWEITPPTPSEFYLIKIRGEREDAEKIIGTHPAICQGPRELKDAVYQWAIFLVGASWEERSAIQEQLGVMSAARPAAAPKPAEVGAGRRPEPPAPEPEPENGAGDLGGILAELTGILGNLTDLTPEEQTHVIQKMGQRMEKPPPPAERPSPPAPAPSPLSDAEAPAPQVRFSQPEKTDKVDVERWPYGGGGPEQETAAPDPDHSALPPVSRPEGLESTAYPPVAPEPPPAAGDPVRQKPSAPRTDTTFPNLGIVPAAPRSGPQPPQSPAPEKSPPAVPPAPPPQAPAQSEPASESPFLRAPAPPHPPDVPEDQLIRAVCVYPASLEGGTAKGLFLQQLKDSAQKKAKKPFFIHLLHEEAVDIGPDRPQDWIKGVLSSRAEFAFIIIPKNVSPESMEEAVRQIQKGGLHCHLISETEVASRILYIDLVVEFMLAKQKE